MSKKTSAIVVGLALLALASAAVAKTRKEKDRKADEKGPRLSSGTFEGLEWRGIGPALMSGRISDIALHPHDRNTWYVAAGSGNVWKTTNAGTTWTPIFDEEGSYSIGCVTVDPRKGEVVWVGTGENVGGRHVGFGDGVYRSLDAGKSWERMGLSASEHIGRILVDPRDSDVVYVAAQGPLWSPGGERGLYKTPDGGKTWKQLLAGGPYTGVTDVVFDPRDPDVLYAATHQRLRNVAALVNGGPESAIHKSTDGGATWRKLEGGLPEEEMGKIGLAVSPQQPDVVYATIELAHRKGGLWRSEDAGGSWHKQSDVVAGATGPHYYQEIFASPHRFDRIYMMDSHLRVSEDGGKSWQDIEGQAKHVDNHALAFDPADPEYLLVGCDGGLYESHDLGETWRFFPNLPVTQFYKVAVDYDTPFYNVYGGTQDNGSQGGPSRTDNVSGIRSHDWFITLFADGHQSAADPTNPDIVYAEWQVGNLVRHDRRTGQIVHIKPQPGADEPSDRFNWDSPIMISPHEAKTLFFASHRVWRSDDRGDSWRAISPDLTRARDRLTLPMMGRVQSWDALWDVSAMSEYGTITSLAQSPLDAKLLWAGTDDGLVQVSEDGGASWRKIDRLPGVPELAFVNDVKADLHDRSAAYVALDNHKSGDFRPYLLKTRDLGRSWTSIAGDLPDRHLVWRLVQDHVRPELLFAGTEFGVFFTVDGGSRWVKLEGGVPNIPFRDLAIQRRENDLVGATFGRGFYILDDYSLLRQISEASLAEGAALYPVRDAPWYVERRPLGGRGRAWQGSSYFVAPNPPFGALFRYYLREEIRSAKKQRLEKEKELVEKGEGTPSPDWDALRREREEQDPSILLTVRDAEGSVVRRLTGPVTAGIHLVAWDLHHPSPRPWAPKKEPAEEEQEEPDRGFLAPPGTYTVELAKLVDGVVTELGKRAAFRVVPLGQGTLPGATAEELASFLRRLERVDRDAGASRSSIDEAKHRLETMQEVLSRSTLPHAELDREVLSLASRVRDLERLLLPDPDRDIMNAQGPIPIAQRIDAAKYGVLYSTYGPTPTHRKSVEIAESALGRLREELSLLLRIDLPALEQRLDEAGVPLVAGAAMSRALRSEIVPIPILSDNYVFAIVEGERALLVDPGEAGPALAFLEREQLSLEAILLTHHHGDHVGGVSALVRQFPAVPVLGGARDRARLPPLTQAFREGEEAELLGVAARVIDLPGHTSGHIGWLLPRGAEGGELFSGDTVFGGTIGNLFEGTPDDMFRSLSKIRALPRATRIWCGHEYTLTYVREAARFDPSNACLAQRLARLEAAGAGALTLPLTLEEECLTNPFFRWDDAQLVERLGTEPGLETFRRLSELL